MSDVLRVLDLGCGKQPLTNWIVHGLADEVRRLVACDRHTRLDIRAIDCVVNAEMESRNDNVRNVRIKTREATFATYAAHAQSGHAQPCDVGLWLYPMPVLVRALADVENEKVSRTYVNDAINALRYGIRDNGLIVFRNENGIVTPTQMEDAMRRFAQLGDFTPLTSTHEPHLFDKRGSPYFNWHSPKSWGEKPATTWLFRRASNAA